MEEFNESMVVLFPFSIYFILFFLSLEGNQGRVLNLFQVRDILLWNKIIILSPMVAKSQATL